MGCVKMKRKRKIDVKKKTTTKKIERKNQQLK